MIDILFLQYEDFTWRIKSVVTNTNDVAEKERLEKLSFELGICNQKFTEYPLTDANIEHLAKLLKVDAKTINLDIEAYDYLKEKKALGFSEEDIAAIESHFTCRIPMSDWNAMELIKHISEEDEADYSEQDNFLKLPSGNCVIFDENLLSRELKNQMD